jgi:hypothetical protein
MLAGLDRAARHDLLRDDIERIERYRDHGRDYVSFPDELWEVLGTPLALTRDLLERDEASGRFIELFAEMLTVAVIARRAYGDVDLTEDKIREYLSVSFEIFNSFRHA